MSDPTQAVVEAARALSSYHVRMSETGMCGCRLCVALGRLDSAQSPVSTSGEDEDERAADHPQRRGY